MFLIRKFPLVFVTAAALGVTLSPAWGKVVVPSKDELPVLKEETQHQTACSRTANYFLRSHYKPVNLDQEFAKKVLDQYLSFLDYSRSLFIQSEVDKIYANKSSILNAINQCDLSYPYSLYNTTMEKRFNKYEALKEILTKEKLNLDEEDRIAIDHSKSPYAKDEEELRKYWTQEVKNELINQLLNGRSLEEAKKKLVRRYDAALSRLVQTNSEDAFSTFENAFATAIDPHTNYLSPVASENFNDDINLSLEGIGAVLTSDDEYTLIHDLIPGSPASLSKKLKNKDKIVGVKQEDGTYDDIIGWRLNEVVKKIKGPKGTKVTLEIERESSSGIENFSVTLTREKIRLQDREAKGEVKEVNGDKIGVISIKSFYTNLHKDLKKEIEKLNSQKIKSLVIDLRSNGGGLLPEATLSTGLFIGKGPIVLVQDAQGNVIPQLDADDTISYSGPMVVLINRLSASSSEIMAAALRDYGRAVIVGDTSFGKGTVQQSRPLSRVYDFSNEPLGSVHYTIAKFYRINGGSTQLKGVEADIHLPTMLDNNDYGEKTETNALQWDKIESVKYSPYLNIDAYVPELNNLHKQRVKDNKVFAIFKSELDRYHEIKAKGYLSLKLDERREIKKRDDATRLENTNTRLQLMGKQPIKKLDDLDDDFEFDDVILDEAVRIADDLAGLIAKKEHKAENTPIFTRYKIDTDEPKAKNTPPTSGI